MLPILIGDYSPFFEPYTEINLLNISNNQKSYRLQVNTAYNGDLIISVDAALELGWCETTKKTNFGLADGSETSGISVFGSLVWLGQIRQVNVLVIELEVLSGIEGHIGMGLLKSSRIDFGKNDFNITTLEG
jgi:hypothetical protein